MVGREEKSMHSFTTSLLRRRKMAENDAGSVGVMLALLLNLHFSRWCVGLTL